MGRLSYCSEEVTAVKNVRYLSFKTKQINVFRLADELIGCTTIVIVEIISSQQEVLHCTALM